MLSSLLRLFNKFELLIVVLVTLLAAGAALAIAQYGSGLFFGILGLLVAGVVLLVAVFKQPAWGAALILVLAPFEGSLEIGGQSAVRLATLLCVVVLVVYVILKQRKLVFDQTTVWTLLLVAWAFITILWSNDPEGSLPDWYSFALQSLIYFILINLIFSLKGLKLALWGHVIGGLIFSLVFINLMVTREFLRNEDFLGLGVNLASRLIGLNLLISMLLYQMEKNWLAKIVLIFSIIVAAIGVVIAFSRGTWVGVVASLGILITIYIAKKEIHISAKQVFVWALVAVVGFYILNTFVLDPHAIEKLTQRFQSGVTLSDSAGGRFEIWKVAWKVFMASPIWGHGFDTFPSEFFSYAEQTGLSNFFHVNEAKQAHNAYVKIIAELGLIGIGFFVALLVSVLKRIWKVWTAKQTNTPAFAWAFALFVYLFVATLVDSSVVRKYFWYTLSIIILLIQYWRSMPSAETASTPEDTE